MGECVNGLYHRSTKVIGQGVHICSGLLVDKFFTLIFNFIKEQGKIVLTGEIDRPSTERVEPVRGCLNNPSRLEWTTLTSLTTPLAALRSSMKTREK
jgi:hypothetical protein